MQSKYVIVGGGAGGLELACKLGRKLGPQQVMLVDSRLYHIWKPSLHEVAAGTLDIHQEGLSYQMLAHDNGFTYVYGTMTALDSAGKQITVAAITSEGGETVLPERAFGQDRFAALAGNCRDGDLLAGAVQRRHGAIDIGETIVVRQHLVGQAFLVDVQGAGRHLMQRRLPDVVKPAIDQHHLLRAELAAQFAGQLKAARPSTYDHIFALQTVLPNVGSGRAGPGYATGLMLAVAFAVALSVAVAMAVVFVAIAAVIAVVVAVTATTTVVIAIAWCVFVGVPLIAHEVDIAAASIVLAAVFSPIFSMAWRNAQVERLGDNACRALDDHWLRVQHRWRRHIAEVDAAIEAWLADGDRNANIGGESRSAERQHGGG